MNLAVLIAALLSFGNVGAANVAVLHLAATRVAESFGYTIESSQYMEIFGIGKNLYEINTTLYHEPLILQIYANLLEKMALTPYEWLSTAETTTFAGVCRWVSGCDNPSDTRGGVCPINVSYGVLAGVLRFTNFYETNEHQMRVARLTVILRAVSLSFSDARYLAEKVLGVKITDNSLRARMWMSIIDSALRWPCHGPLNQPCLCDFEDSSLYHMHPSVYTEWIFTPRFMTFDAAWTQHYAYVACNGHGWPICEWDRMAFDAAETLARQHFPHGQPVASLQLTRPRNCLFLRDILYWSASETNPVPLDLTLDLNLYQSVRAARIVSVVNGYAHTHTNPISQGASINRFVHYETFPLLAESLFAMYPSGIPSELLQELIEKFTPYACRYLSEPDSIEVFIPAHATLPLSRTPRLLYSTSVKRYRKHFAMNASGVADYTHTTPHVAYMAQVLAYELYWQPLCSLLRSNSVPLIELLSRLVPETEHWSDSFSVLKVVFRAFGLGDELSFHSVYILVFIRHFIVEQLVSRLTEDVRLPWFPDVALPHIFTNSVLVLGYSAQSISAQMALALCFFLYISAVRSSSMPMNIRNTDIVLKEQLRVLYGVLPESFADFLTRMTPDGNVLLVTIFAANLAMFYLRDSQAMEPDAQLACARVVQVTETCGVDGVTVGGSCCLDIAQDGPIVYGEILHEERLPGDGVNNIQDELIERHTDRDHLMQFDGIAMVNGIAGNQIGVVLSNDTDGVEYDSDSEDSFPKKKFTLRTLTSWMRKSPASFRRCSSQQLGQAVHRLDRSTDPDFVNSMESDNTNHSDGLQSSTAHVNELAPQLPKKRKTFIKRAIKPLSRTLRASFHAFSKSRSNVEDFIDDRTHIPLTSYDPVIIAYHVDVLINQRSLEYQFLDIVLPRARMINRTSVTRWARSFNFDPQTINFIADAIPNNKTGIPREKAIVEIYTAVMSLSTRAPVIAENVSLLS